MCITRLLTVSLVSSVYIGIPVPCSGFTSLAYSLNDGRNVYVLYPDSISIT